MNFTTLLKFAKPLLFLFVFNPLSHAHAGEPPTEPILRIDPDEHTARITSLASDAKGRYLVTASDDKTARVWSLLDGRLLSTLRVPIDSGHEGKLYAVALSPDGTVVALGGHTRVGETEGSIFLFERISGRLIRRITGLDEAIHGVAFSPNGLMLAASLADKGIRLFSVSDGHLLAEDRDFDGDSNSVHFSPDGARLVATGYDFIRLYEVNLTHWKNGLNRIAKYSTRDDDPPARARFSPDGTQIAVGFKHQSAVNVLDASNLSFLYAANKMWEPYNLRNVEWTTHGLAAAGTAQKQFNGQPQVYIRYWQGNNVQDIPVSDNTVQDLLALQGDRLAFSTASSWGVLDGQGKLLLRHTPVIADFRDNWQVNSSPANNAESKTYVQGFTISPDGSRVRFGYERLGKNSVVFDTALRQFLPSNTPGLESAIIGTPALSVTEWKGSPVPRVNGKFLELNNQLSTSLALLPDGSGFALGTTFSLRLFDQSGKQRWMLPTSQVVEVNVSLDSRWVVAAHTDGTIRWYRTSDGVEQLAFFPHADRKRWIMWTPEGYYDASPGAEDLIGWHLNQGKDKEARFIPSGQLYDVFFRPDIVQAKFRGEDISSMITITAAQALKMPPPVLSFTRVPSSTKLNTEKVCYKAIATGGGIGEVRLFQNGKLIKSDGFYRETVAKVNTSMKLAAMDSATVTRALKLTKAAQNSEPPMVSNDKGNEYSECQEIETIPGDNEISVAAFNANNTIQSALETTHFTADRKAEAPHLYVLGVGINKYRAKENNLSFAVKDATDFRSMIQDKAKGLFDAKNIHIEGLNDAQATKAGIQKAIAAISAKVKPWDSFILFVASHGYLQDNQYYIVTSDFDGAIDTTKMISSNEIVGMSKNIKSLSQLLIFDTCHAGGVDNIIGGLYDARMSVMAKKMGLHIYASAGSTQTALDGYKGNGLFTHALLGSMKNNTTDSNRDSEVSVAELGERAKQETMTISTKLGFPQSPNIINFGKDNALFRVK